MIPTVFGCAIALVGVVLLVIADVPAMFGFVVLCSVLGGASAVDLPALGGSTIPPLHFALGFLMLRCLLPGSGQGEFARAAFRSNLPLIIFVAYGVVIAYVGPRLFAEQMTVVPMRYVGTATYATFPLRPTPQNITAAIYLIGTLMCAIGAYIACSNEGGGRVLVKAGIAAACFHIFFGVTGALFAGTEYATVLQFFRNGNYAQLDQRIGDFARMSGIFPEPSGFAAYGLVWFVFLFECWFRRIMPRVTGPIAVCMAVTLVFSTSSTAYLGLALYAVLFGFRTLILPEGASSAKLVRIALGLLIGSIAIATLLLLTPGLASRIGSIITTMTVGKQSSASATQRAFWAHQGLQAFGVSFGLGIGPGSFRSSSQMMAVLGCTGIVGAVSFVMYVLAVLKPLRASTYNVPTTRSNAIGVAGGWSAFCLLITAAFIAPSPDPGSDFAMLAGASLALRKKGAWRAAVVESPTEDLPAPSAAPINAELLQDAEWSAVIVPEKEPNLPDRTRRWHEAQHRWKSEGGRRP